MKKYLHSTWMRVLSSIICTVSVLTLTVGVLDFVVVAEFGGTSEVYETGYDRVAQNYALYAIDMIETNRQDELEGEFIKKGIACTIDRISLTQTPDGTKETVTTPVFVGGNFNEAPVHELEMIAGSNNRYSENSIFRVLSDYAYYSDSAAWVDYAIERIVFDHQAGIFYYDTPIGYFAVDYLEVVQHDGTYIDYKLKDIEGPQGYYKGYYNGYYKLELDTTEYREWSSVRINDNTLPIGEPDVEFSNEVHVVHNVSELEETPLDYTYESYDDILSCSYADEMDKYYVKISWSQYLEDIHPENSLFMEWKGIYQTITGLYSWAVPMIVLSTITFIVSLALMICSAKKDKETMNFMEKLPVCIYTCAVFWLDVLFVFLAVSLVAWLVQNDIGDLWDIVTLIVLVAVIGVWLALNWFQNIVTRIKCKSFWRTTEVYYIYKICKDSWSFITKPVKWCWEKFMIPFQAFGRISKQGLHMAGKNIPLFWGGLIVLGLISLIDFALATNLLWYGETFPFIFFKIVEAVVLVIVLFHMQELHAGSKRVVAGDMSQPIDTSRMFWKFREHGENINKVSDGIALAVNERMKSEHFKTELITNVSHDIKTPLTSIINYVDLIKKEDVQDEKLQEYVDVLDRQSARLKKLIEDLMEASKASTGNLAVNLEECDVEVLLTQVIGEFEERLQKNQLAVVVEKPDCPVKMMADGRHIWRVLDNLLNNACKYSLPRTRVYVSLKQENQDAVIVFKNISKEALNIPSEELMERFVRGDSSRNTEGSGLGLSIAQSLTELMHGSMKLEIDGDLFKVTLRFPTIVAK